MGNLFGKYLILLGIFMAFAAPAYADHAKVEAIGGADAITVKRGDKKVKLAVGEALLPGDELSTDAKTAVDVRFENQTLVRVGVNSTYKIVDDNGAKHFLHRLFSGIVRVLVPVRKDAKGEIKFKMQTPEGTIGVRGTEFVVDRTKAATKLRGLSGTVMFGAAQADFSHPEKFVLVGRGFESSVVKGKQPTKPKKFPLADYLKYIDSKGKGPFAAGLIGRSSLHVHKRKYKAPQRITKTAAPEPEVEKAMFAAKPKAEPEKEDKSKTPEKDYNKLLLLAAGKQGATASQVRDLLKKGADANTRDQYGNTPLHNAAVYGRNEIIQLLVDAGKANVNLQNKREFTPLMEAANEGSSVKLTTVQALVENEADPNIKTKDGVRALEIARSVATESRNEEVIKYLESVTGPEEN